MSFALVGFDFLEKLWWASSVSGPHSEPITALSRQLHCLNLPSPTVVAASAVVCQLHSVESANRIFLSFHSSPSFSQIIMSQIIDLFVRQKKNEKKFLKMREKHDNLLSTETFFLVLLQRPFKASS